MKIRLYFGDVNSEAEERMSDFITGVIDSILTDDKIKTCIRMIYDVYGDYEEELNCTNKKKFQDIIKLLIKIDDMEKRDKEKYSEEDMI